MKPASQARTVLCVGDIHGRWAWLASILLYCQPDVCLCAGDFGWFPRLIQPPSLALPREVLERTEIRFCDGNHEDHSSLLASAPRGSFEPVELAPGIVYQPRGSAMDLADGRRVLFVGGAKSVDWRFRTRGRDWFPEEILEPRHLPSPLPQADVVVSHTAPLRFGLDRFGRGCAFGPGFDASPDPSRETLDLVLEGAKPRVWIAGHWHEREDWMLGRLECHVLDMVTGGLC
ncbi:MAG: metallophosphoesterase, partial [Desulfovibrio sp.]|nr:metallophosphoesterase [Desulfovibrio sp.]